MPKVIKDDIANEIANDVLTLIKSKDNTFSSAQIVAIINAARTIEMQTRPAKEIKVEKVEAVTDSVDEVA